MENIYLVQVGTMTRAQKLIVNHWFICRTEAKYSTVLSFYYNKYSGLSVQVTRIDPVKIVDELIVSDNPEMSADKKEIIRLNNELEAMKKESATKYVSGSIDIRNLSEEAKASHKKMEEIHSAYLEQREIVRKGATSYIRSKYPGMLYSVTISKITHDANKVEFDATLDVTLKIKGNEL